MSCIHLLVQKLVHGANASLSHMPTLRPSCASAYSPRHLSWQGHYGRQIVRSSPPYGFLMVKRDVPGKAAL